MSDTAFADMTALIIDDQEFVVNIVCKMMEQIGFGRIETAADGQAGLHAMTDVRPHVVLCDIEMRPMDGLTFLKEHLISIANLFCYGQVESPYGSGDFIKELRRLIKEHENLILSEISSKEAIYDSIRTFLGKGK